MQGEAQVGLRLLVKEARPQQGTNTRGGGTTIQFPPKEHQEVQPNSGQEITSEVDGTFSQDGRTSQRRAGRLIKPKIKDRERRFPKEFIIKRGGEITPTKKNIVPVGTS